MTTQPNHLTLLRTHLTTKTVTVTEQGETTDVTAVIIKVIDGATADDFTLIQTVSAQEYALMLHCYFRRIFDIYDAGTNESEISFARHYYTLASAAKIVEDKLMTMHDDLLRMI